MKNKTAIITVTKSALQNGIALASFIGADVYCTRSYELEHEFIKESRDKFSGVVFSESLDYSVIEGRLSDYTKVLFETYEALIFVMATGIVVRCIAEHIRSKTTDPAVVVMDEKFNFAISLLSGHLGGANDLAKKLSEITGATPVITTATDIRGVTAFDNIAKINQCVIENMENLKTISNSLLQGEIVYLYCPYEIEKIPENIILDDFNTITHRKNAVVISNVYFENECKVLKIRPRNLFLGMGFKKGIKSDMMLKYFEEFTCENHLSAYSFAGIATISLKEDDDEIKDFAGQLNLPLKYYDSSELEPYEEMFSHSEFVKSVTGVPSVCEPCAYLASEFGAV